MDNGISGGELLILFLLWIIFRHLLKKEKEDEERREIEFNERAREVEIKRLMGKGEYK